MTTGSSLLTVAAAGVAACAHPTCWCSPHVHWSFLASLDPLLWYNTHLSSMVCGLLLQYTGEAVLHLAVIQSFLLEPFWS